ncbi:uncharacterized protein LOC126909639 [Daktulosphaira vitifoliae]|uniref:uncharacterized protein LOC126909639 n=1 Tax=Daktulosphaira vitifoliae TaxID=58002 RepID=UPI0021AAD42F|nr:uncharacterized protein LOC126909639 [Daktulosphaira vitifoliae]
MEGDSIYEINHEELPQDSIDTYIKDLEDIIQENELPNNSPNWIVASLDDVFMWIQKHLNRFFKSDQILSTKQLKKQIKITKLNDMINHLKNIHSTYEYKLEKKENFYQNAIKSLESKISKMLEDNRKLQDSVKSYSTHATMELEKMNVVIKEMEIDTKFKKNQKMLQKITKSNGFINHLKNMLSTYESEVEEKENIYINTIKRFESKSVKLVEENVNLLVNYLKLILIIKV